MDIFLPDHSCIKKVPIFIIHRNLNLLFTKRNNVLWDTGLIGAWIFSSCTYHWVVYQHIFTEYWLCARPCYQQLELLFIIIFILIKMQSHHFSLLFPPSKQSCLPSLQYLPSLLLLKLLAFPLWLLNIYVHISYTCIIHMCIHYTHILLNPFGAACVYMFRGWSLCIVLPIRGIFPGRD